MDMSKNKRSGCCSNLQRKEIDKKDNKVTCPVCCEISQAVKGKTLERLLTDVAKNKIACFDGFYFCKTPLCDVVYAKDDMRLTQEDVRVVVGCKANATPSSVCYCFNWTRARIKKEIKETGRSTALSDIKGKMKNPGCACETLNPSGRCCLGDVRQAVKWVCEG